MAVERSLNSLMELLFSLRAVTTPLVPSFSLVPFLGSSSRQSDIVERFLNEKSSGAAVVFSVWITLVGVARTGDVVIAIPC